MSPLDDSRPDGQVVTIDDHWRELVTVALLGTDRRDPPEPHPALADLVDDTARTTPSQRLLAHVAACAVVRRAGVTPGPILAPMFPSGRDERPVCVPAATQRWTHVTQSWPVLEDEWMLTLIRNGWRAAPEIVPAMLHRHRGDVVRRARAEAAAGPLAAWLVELRPELAPRTSPSSDPLAEAIGELPALPIPPALASLVGAPGDEVGTVVGSAVEHGDLGPSHRAVLVNLVARVRPDGLGEIATALENVDPTSPGHGMAGTLADLARTRHRMLDELSRA